MFEEMDTTDSTHLHPNSSKRGRHDHPSLSLQEKRLTMLSEEQVPETIEETIEEMDLTDSTDLQLNVSQSKENKQKEDIPCSIIEKHVFILKSPPESPLTLVSAPSEFKENVDISDTMDVTTSYFRNWAKEQTIRSLISQLEQLGFTDLQTKIDEISNKVESLHQKNSNKMELAHSPRKHSFGNEENWKSINLPFPSFKSSPFLEKYKFEHYFESFRQKENQFAFSVVLMADGLTEFLPAVAPQHRKNNPAGSRSEPTLHSEEILSSQLDTFINQNKFRVRSVLIYTYHSPCLKRGGKHCPCMFLLHDKAQQWHHKYRIITEVWFTDFWGLDGHSSFKDPHYSHVPESVKAIPQYKTTKLNLDSNSLDKYSTCQLKRFKENVKPEFQKLITEARSKCCSIEDHIKHGRTRIDVFDIHHQQKPGLTVSWEKMVHEDLLPQIRQIVYADFNVKVVSMFQRDLELLFQGNSPMKLYHYTMNTQEGL